MQTSQNTAARAACVTAASIAVGCAVAELAADAAVAAELVVNLPRDLIAAFDATRAVSVHAWARSYQWAADNYARTPALMVGLAAVLLLPPLALASGLIARLALPRLTARAAAEVRSTDAVSAARYSAARDHPINMAWPREAWLTRDQSPGDRHPDLHRTIPRELLSIGRGEDNDLVLDEATVHRYHALIQRTPDALFLIKDLGGPGGNGVLVNDELVTEAHLLDTDRITLGAVTLVFHARRIGGSSLSDGQHGSLQ